MTAKSETDPIATERPAALLIAPRVELLGHLLVALRPLCDITLVTTVDAARTVLSVTSGKNQWRAILVNWEGQKPPTRAEATEYDTLTRYGLPILMLVHDTMPAGIDDANGTRFLPRAQALAEVVHVIRNFT